MKQLIQSELSRLVMRRRTAIILIISLLAFIFIAFFNSTFGVGFYDPFVTANLDSLNFTPFILRDYHFYLVLILCPLLVVENIDACDCYGGIFNHIVDDGKYICSADVT